MTDPAPPARYDSPWKAALTYAFREFMSFFFAELGAGIDWSHRPLFRDKELAGLNVGGPPDGLVADLLAEVCVLGDHARMLIHVEVQTQRDAAFARRVFDYNYRIDRQHARPVASLVVLADNDPRWRPIAYHRKIKGTMTTFYFYQTTVPTSLA
jgi:hypothetical protein